MTSLHFWSLQERETKLDLMCPTILKAAFQARQDGQLLLWSI